MLVERAEQVYVLIIFKIILLIYFISHFKKIRQPKSLLNALTIKIYIKVYIAVYK